ncbi:hypothetical protein GLOIN_2v1775009 [Rhizophagus irregularis DAOM 181602=DAOM 197198]|uniref:Uncharacterized protein n=1 Tax=Rhizophagus irregularis (strain DAOM 181602 / DAOM 197198 / MUCL 43194) TaxID=747089 RepID=A0A2P4Q0S4_RHIID|nr:hypothetical protein GLOIN_2v1775009 [Rhizophagus irregularis DAOM 181602=DAOM 197198]POG71257.1 hypothetical protein GLOIN_2v1775009 [Rhizophagus irregularis DAOM 181602=DAOM 197198]|eukprot:XP_025178123.1 hypothetical protein GLOIN_2v1775009 [Rhizophagus irregularis DAOM 181602=DAOM 197198]
MADTQGIKLRYKRGTCFGCQKCLYCGVDLQQQKCKCKTSTIPNKKNRTTAVKYAFTLIFSPDWTKDKFSFIQEKALKYNYLINLKNTFNLSLCSKCNNTLSRLTPKNSKNIKSIVKPTETLPNLEVSQNTQSKPERQILDGASTQNSLETLESDKNSEDNAYSADDDFEYEFQYGIFIKLDGKLQPAKWYKVVVSGIDEFLAEIHTNVVTLTQNESIEACDYHVAFKSEKALGAGTQLVDAQDFQKFCLDYSKFKKRNTNMGIFITIKSQDLNKNKRKKKHKNKNRVSKTSSLTSEETQIAKNVSEICTINHCNIHNRACLNRDNSKENHVEITFMMLSIWASEMNKGLATPMNPPTHPLFAYRHPSKTKPSYLQPSAENSLLPSSSYIPFSLYNSLQMFPAPYTAHVLEQTPTMTTKLPTISDFLKQIDDNEVINGRI